MNTISTFAFICIVASTTAGCVAEDDDPENAAAQAGDSEPAAGEENGTSAPEELSAPIASPGEGRDVSSLNLGPTYTEYALPARGGWGGGYTGHVGGGIIYAVRMN